MSKKKPDAGPGAAPDPDPVTESFTERVERRLGPTGPEWRCVITHVSQSGSTNMDTGWHPRRRFNMEYAVLHRKQINFVVGDVSKAVAINSPRMGS